MCPDIPVPVLAIVEQTENPGMAKNVERNIKNISDICDIVTNQNWENVTKTRIYTMKVIMHLFSRYRSSYKRIDIKKYLLTTI